MACRHSPHRAGVHCPDDPPPTEPSLRPFSATSRAIAPAVTTGEVRCRPASPVRRQRLRLAQLRAAQPDRPGRELPPRRSRCSCGSWHVGAGQAPAPPRSRPSWRYSGRVWPDRGTSAGVGRSGRVKGWSGIAASHRRRDQPSRERAPRPHVLPACPAGRLGGRPRPARRPAGPVPPRYPRCGGRPCHPAGRRGARHAPPGRRPDGEIVGRPTTAGRRGMVVRIDGSTDRPDGSTFHITGRSGRGRRAEESNDVIAERGWTPFRPDAGRLTLRLARPLTRQLYWTATACSPTSTGRDRGARPAAAGVREAPRHRPLLAEARRARPISISACRCMPDAMELFEAVRHLDPIILTGLPRGNWAADQKVRWAAQYFPARGSSPAWRATSATRAGRATSWSTTS